MTTVDEAENAVDHRIADGDQCILAAHRDACQQIGQKLCSHEKTLHFLQQVSQAKRRQGLSLRLRSVILSENEHQPSTLWVLTNSNAPSEAFLI